MSGLFTRETINLTPTSIPPTQRPSFLDPEDEQLFQSFWKNSPPSLHQDEAKTRSMWMQRHIENRQKAKGVRAQWITDTAEKLVPDVLRACDSILASPTEVVERAYALAAAMWERKGK